MFCSLCLHSSLWSVESSVYLRSSLRQPRYLRSETRWVNDPLFSSYHCFMNIVPNKWSGLYFLCTREFAWEFNVVFIPIVLLVLIKEPQNRLICLIHLIINVEWNNSFSTKKYPCSWKENVCRKNIDHILLWVWKDADRLMCDIQRLNKMTLTPIILQ